MFFTKWKKQERINEEVGHQLEVLDKSLQDSFGNVKSDVKLIKDWIGYLHQNQDTFTNKFDATIEGIEARFSDLLTRDEIKFFVDEYYKNVNYLNQAISTVREGVNKHFTAIYSTQRDIFTRLETLSKANSDSVGSVDTLRQEIGQNIGTVRQEVSKDMDSLRMEIKSLLSGILSSKISEVPTPQVSSKVYLEKEARDMSSLPQPIFDRLEQMNEKINDVQTKLAEKSNTRMNLREKILKKVTRHSKEYVKSMLISMIKKYNKISGLSLREMVVEEQGIVSKSSFYRLLEEIEGEESINVVHEGKEKHYFWTLSNVPSAK